MGAVLVIELIRFPKYLIALMMLQLAKPQFVPMTMLALGMVSFALSNFYHLQTESMKEDSKFLNYLLKN